MKRVQLWNGDFLSAKTEEELEEQVLEYVEGLVSLCEGGPNNNPEHSTQVEQAFDQCMATMEDVE